MTRLLVLMFVINDNFWVDGLHIVVKDFFDGFFAAFVAWVHKVFVENTLFSFYKNNFIRTSTLSCWLKIFQKLRRTQNLIMETFLMKA